jgi:hypothetical protein
MPKKKESAQPNKDSEGYARRRNRTQKTKLDSIMSGIRRRQGTK